ncbi:unnamed protein product [Alopecurus aequalis]
MAEIILLLVIKKMGVALANGAAVQASVQFSEYATQLIELQRSMGRVLMELRVMHDVLSQMDIRNRNNPVYEGWLDEVRKVAHVMEDMVDEYLHQVGMENDIGCCFYVKNGLRRPRSLLSLNQIASDVKETEKDLAHLSETKNRWVSMVNNGDASSTNYIVKRSVVFNEAVMYTNSLSTDVSPVSSDDEREISVQVEHADDIETEIVVDDVYDTVQQSPPILQPQNLSIAERRTSRNKGPAKSLIEECDIAHYAFSCAEQVENTHEPSTYTEVVGSGDREKWVSAMQEEMQSLEKNGTWDGVRLPKQKKTVRCKWIFKRKEGLSHSEPPRFKARLVVKGFSQISGVDYNDVFSPVVKHSSIRTFFGIVAMRDLELEQLDVKTAFLHGELEEEIYMDQPEGFIVPGKEDHVCKLKRSLYGLKQSPRRWYKRFDSFMLSHGFKRSEFDSCVYIKFVDGSPIYLLLYVDDMLIAAKSKKEITTLKAQLSSEFEMKDLGAAKKILALQCASTDEDYEYMSRVPYSSAVGSLMYAMVCSRPDLSYAMSLVSRYMANPGKEHWKVVQWIFRYLRGTSNACLNFGKTGEGLKGYVDSDFAADLDKRRSLTGYVFTLGGYADQIFHERTKHIDVKYHYVRDVVAQDGKCSVITLHGMGGLGKTVLAANVYRKQREKFQCHAWVSISQTYSREDVLRNIIKELYKDKVDVPSNISTMDITCLEDTLKRFLEQQKYLIILDDVWTPEAFDDLSRALLCNEKGSTMLITTREGEVASLASEGQILTLEALPEDKAWDLFCKKSFPRGKNQECPEDLKPLSKEIVSRCKGLPLAIVSVGSLLHVREKTVDEWRRINDQLSWEIINNSRLDHMRNVLHLSFIYLPTYLKSCFLYCSLFSEDYLFHRKELVRLWMAEGFIMEKGTRTLEEVAEGYLKELVNRNMLQLVGRNSFGRMNRFRMHDIIRELAIDLCQKDHFGVKLRTFITLDKNIPSFTLLPLLSEKSRYMTVLELSGLPIEKIPYAIGDLFNLRHLGLRDTKVKLLPKSVEKLSNLFTLDLYGSDIQKVPAGVVKLKNLRHLFAVKINDQFGRALLSCSGVRITKGLGNLTNLQTLQALEAQHESVRQLGELRQLKSLTILNVKGIYCQCICESVVHMPFLSFLDVAASDENKVLMLNTLPRRLQKLSLRGRLVEGTLLRESPLLQSMGQSLHELLLCWSQLREDPLPSLSRLSNLTILHFTRAYNGEKLVFLTGWFPKLKVLYLRDLLNLKLLEIKQGAMATLEVLTLVNLNNMAEVPVGIEFVLPLMYLGFVEITCEFLTLLRQCRGLAGMQWGYSLRD